ncbi:MAG: hypothetical protein AB1403_24310 [Candidatus Riflebacteria bacterium]
MARDEFSAQVKRKIARRAAYTCSNPDCKRRTLIPEISNQTESINIGKASHITAASKGGPRYDPSLTKEQRKSAENGIHLCSVCADRIDANGGNDYSASFLREWKIIHDNWLLEQQKNNSEQRREFNKFISPYWTQDIVYNFKPEERASGYIIIPEFNSNVASRSVNVIGRMEKLVSDSKYWVAVSPYGALGMWWAQSEIVLSLDNFWKVENIRLGREFPDGKGDVGRIFDIGLFETTEIAHEKFFESKNKDVGMEKPFTAFLLWKVSVLRTA